jgi:hypothetical protein
MKLPVNLLLFIFFILKVLVIEITYLNIKILYIIFSINLKMQAGYGKNIIYSGKRYRKT